MRYVLFITVILIGQGCLQDTSMLLAQSREEIQCLKLRTLEEAENMYLAYSKETAGGSVMTAGWFFRFYKKFISSQDYGNCSFTPSCSEYGIIAIREEGLLVGFVNTLDRLTRCHGKNNPYYPKDEEKGLLIDEVRNHKYEKD
jgi:uncharacterized protein